MSYALFGSLVLGVMTPQAYATDANGGWVQQTVSLNPGWNILWLNVDPVPSDPATAFSGLGTNLEAAWTFVAPEVKGKNGRWARYAPGHPSFISNMVAVRGGSAYFVKMTAAANLTVTGRPVLPALRLTSNSMSLFGGALDPNNLPLLFNEFFSPAIVADVQNVFALVSGNYQSLALNQSMGAGVGYWAKLNRNLVYPGPIAVDSPVYGMQFHRDGYTKSLEVTIPLAATARTVTMRALSSVLPPAGYPSLAEGGYVDWLEYENPLYTPSGTQPHWLPLSQGVNLTVPANKTSVSMTLRANRVGRSVALFDPQDPSGSSLYQAVIEVVDGKGARVRIPTGMQVKGVKGTWIGEVTLDNVSVSNLVSNPSGSTKAPSVSMSIILSIDPDGGQYKLLRELVYNVDRDAYRLNYTYSAVMFHEDTSLAAGGTVGQPGSTLSGTIFMGASHALNPYRHRYHPEHQTGLDVTRDITLTFLSNLTSDSEFELVQTLHKVINEPTGNNQLVGSYEEVISGVSLEPVSVSGTFRITHMSEDVSP